MLDMLHHFKETIKKNGFPKVRIECDRYIPVGGQAILLLQYVPFANSIFVFGDLLHCYVDMACYC